MANTLQKAASALEKQYSAAITESCGDTSLVLKADQVVAAAQSLRDDFGFDMLVMETAVDYWPQQSPRFHVVYRCYSTKEHFLIGLRVPVDGNNPSIPSLTPVYPNANWHEREIWDMFGIHFEGHPDPRRILMPYDWEGHPLRKDYPLGYEEPQFTFNYEQIAQHKPHPKE
ncbi:MAG TPA: NADH-quinone oxidoreductase subunit C [Longilinea sp.]|nr:NADH-quinone oxidoreductase subunit C [Longilinea sp.]